LQDKAEIKRNNADILYAHLITLSPREFKRKLKAIKW